MNLIYIRCKSLIPNSQFPIPMSLCINPNCPHPDNPDNNLFCKTCGSELLLAGKYRVSQLLSGKGGFGRTYEVSHGSTTKVLKVLINHQPKAIELFEQEARVLRQLNHPGIPRGDRYFTFTPRDSQQPLHCLVMEKIEGLDLEEYQKQRQYQAIAQDLALEWLIQLAQILDEVHQQQFFHRDIKPSNIILKPDGQLVLIDFGTVREITATYLGKQAAGQVTAIASFGYTPPEQLHFQAVPQSDFFALGRTFVFLLTGKEPSDPAIYDPIKNKFNWREQTPHLLPGLADLIDQLMMPAAEKRPANTRVILQRLAEIDHLLNPPLPPRKNRVSSSIGQGNISISLQKTQLPRRGSSSPQQGKIHLQSFDFEVVTVDSFGNEKSRNRRQAKCFTEDLGNGIILEMVAIPGGTFTMGSPGTEKQRNINESPQHTVTIQPFYMGKFTVTQAQWKAVTALPKTQYGHYLSTDPSNFKGNNLPVENVSWHDAREFCSRLSNKTGCTYRLPSEAEWEYACRAGTTTPFHFGEIITTDLANYDGNHTYGLSPKGMCRNKTTPVGSFQVANNFGLYDMHGNVFELCEDHWHGNYQGAPTNGFAWSENVYNGHYSWLPYDLLLRAWLLRRRLQRGGSWASVPQFCRSALRVRYEAGIRLNLLGFRVVCS
ncbi:MAG: SUMF1/EgtB/PvdO family nonheme iron enzyme [Symploca sp. SIO3E6]|nr:SUMF1/EgtB/PvdO family nonheme iron enzyme [Caldora sp. SIO3E6]